MRANKNKQEDYLTDRSANWILGTSARLAWAGSDGDPWTALHCQQLLIGVVITKAVVQAHSALCIALDLFLSNADALFTISLGLLPKQGVRDDRLGALCVLRNLINSAWQPQFVAIVDGVQQLTADVHPAVGGWLSELILTLREAGFLSPTHMENLQQMAHHEEKVFWPCLHFSLTRSREARSGVSILLSKNLPERPSCFKVRNRTGLILNQLANLGLPVRIVLQ